MAIEIPKKGAVEAAPEVKEVKKSEGKKIAVEAIDKGWYGGQLLKPGQKFIIDNEKDFSDNWMIKIK